MNYQVALSFEDGISRFITCDPDETVADASYRARINIPLDCRDGACGTCKALCESGEYDLGDYIDEALTEEEVERGYVLPCQLTPQSDLVLQIPTTSDVAKTEAATHGATLTDITRFSDSTVAFTLELDDRKALAFLPGQYVNIAVPGTAVTRSYSFGNGPDADKVSFLVRILDQGVMSDYLRNQARAGDRLEFTGPMGSFFLRDLKRPALFLAGGTGLAPFLSMLEKLKNSGVEHPVHLVYGVSRDEDLVELETLARYANEIPRFTFDYCVADENSSAPNKGYVTGLMEPQHLNDGDVDVYLCGPPAMVEAVREHMKAQGITPLNFYYEKFNLAVPAAGESDGTTEKATDTTAEHAPLHADEAAGSGRYEIGEEHPSLAESDAQFDARMALELGAMELRIGRLTPEQLVEYRILAEASSASIDADHFVDAAAFTETNAAFHDYLFRCTHNEFLLEAYHRLEVTSFMERVLRPGTWVDQRIPHDHVALVEAFERGDKEAAHQLIVSHSERAKATMRAAIEESKVR